MKVMGEYVEGLSFPVCNKFKPQILDGELCYVLNVSSLKPEEKLVSKAGRGKGLLLAIDNGISIEPQSNINVIQKKKDFIRTELTSTAKHARLHILTLHRHEDSRPGIYTVKNLKYMTGTESFLSMPDDLKKCQIGPKEDCRSRRYVHEVQKTCGCIPWPLSSVAHGQVCLHDRKIISKLNDTFTFILQVDNICSPKQTTCYKELKHKTFGCLVSCSGLYADFSYSRNHEDKIEDGSRILDLEVFSQLIQDYRAYKSKFAQNLKFNSSSPALGGYTLNTST